MTIRKAMPSVTTKAPSITLSLVLLLPVMFAFMLMIEAGSGALSDWIEGIQPGTEAGRPSCSDQSGSSVGLNMAAFLPVRAAERAPPKLL